MFLIFDLEILLIYPLAVTLYQVSTYGFWITMIFFAILTVGFVLEIGSGALYFTNQKSSDISLRPENKLNSQPLKSSLFGLALLTVVSPLSELQTENLLDIINLFSLDETTLCLSSLLISKESSKI